MKTDKPIPKLILLIVYPIMEFLLLIAVGIFSYLCYKEGKIALFIVTGLFSVYVLWRFIDRLKKLVNWLNRSSEEVTEEDNAEEDASPTDSC